MKKSVSVFILFVLFSSIVFASSGTIIEGKRLQIIEVSFDDGEKKYRDIDENDRITGIKPGSSVSIDVEVSNLFSFVELEDVTVEVTIEDLGGFSYQRETDEFDLRGNAERTSSFDFTIPATTPSGSYLVEIIAEGRDVDDYKKQEAEFFFRLEVDQEAHDVSITRIRLVPEKIECGEGVFYEGRITNIGFIDKDIDMTVTSVPLGLSERRSFSVDSNDIRDVKFTFYVPELIEEDTYRIFTEAHYSIGTSKAVSELEVICPETKKEPTKKTKKIHEVYINTLAVVDTSTQNEERFSATNAYVILILGLIALTLLIIIAALVLI